MASDRHQLRIIKRAVDGDAEAFSGLCYRYSDALYRYLYFRLGSVLAAEEVCVQIFVRAWELLPSDPRRNAMPFAAWLFLVANDVVVERNNRFTQAGLHPSRPPLMAWSPTASSKDKPQLHPRFLAQSIMQLDEVAQQVILLRFVIRMSHRDTGLVIGDTSAGSSVLQYRALLEVRETLTRKKMSENAYASDYVGTVIFCLDRIISGRWSPEECLEHLPQDNDRLEKILQFAAMVREASNVRPRRSFSGDLRKELLAELRQSRRRPIRQPWLWRWVLTASERIPPPVIAGFLLGLILFVAVAGTTGIVTTVDGAAPGDRLYDLDLRMERAYRRFLSDPEPRVQFSLRLTNERLAEAESLAERGDASGFQVALVAYSVEVATFVDDSRAIQRADAASEFDRHFSEQQKRLDEIFVTALTAASVIAGGETPSVECEPQGDELDGEVQWHPVGLTLAAQHGVDYHEVMNWVCDGHSFGEIVLGLASVESSSIPTVEILKRKSELGGWGQLWQETQVSGSLPMGEGRNDDQGNFSLR